MLHLVALEILYYYFCLLKIFIKTRWRDESQVAFCHPRHSNLKKTFEHFRCCPGHFRGLGEKITQLWALESDVMRNRASHTSETTFYIIFNLDHLMKRSNRFPIPYTIMTVVISHEKTHAKSAVRRRWNGPNKRSGAVLISVSLSPVVTST